MNLSIKNQLGCSQKLIRVINFIGALILFFSIQVDGINHLIGMYLTVFYIWVYILFLISENRIKNINKIDFIEHIFSHWLILIGFFLPILTCIVARF